MFNRHSMTHPVFMSPLQPSQIVQTDSAITGPPRQNIIVVGGDEIEFRMDDRLIPSVMRTFAGTTPADEQVEAMAIPNRPIWLHICVKLLRNHRARFSRRMGHRCVFELSCSRYAELALRKHGLLKGLRLTVERLLRCRPGAGGIDNP